MVTKPRGPIDPSKGKPADPRRPSTWEHRQTLKKSHKTLSAAEQVAQQYTRQGGAGGGGGGGGKKSGGGLCGIITLALLSIPVSIMGGIAYSAAHFFG